MFEFIPFAILLLLIFYYVRSAYKKQGADVPGGAGEHFPFPPVEDRERQRWPGYEPYTAENDVRKYSFETLEGKSLETIPDDFGIRLAEPTILAAEVEEEMEVQDEIRYGSPEIETQELDLRKAVIYSEILNAKYVKGSDPEA